MASSGIHRGLIIIKIDLKELEHKDADSICLAQG
jgi:hypothetical protein